MAFSIGKIFYDKMKIKSYKNLHKSKMNFNHLPIKFPYSLFGKHPLTREIVQPLHAKYPHGPREITPKLHLSYTKITPKL